MYGCSSLAALPDAIGKLKALKGISTQSAEDAQLAILLEPRRPTGVDRRPRRAEDARLGLPQADVSPPTRTETSSESSASSQTRPASSPAKSPRPTRTTTRRRTSSRSSTTRPSRIASKKQLKDQALAKITNAKDKRRSGPACTDCRRAMEEALRPGWLGPDECPIGPIISKDTATNVVTETDLKLFTSLMDAVDPNPRHIKRVVNILQVINSVAHNTLVDDEDVERGFVDKDDRWDEFRSRLIKWIILAECYPYRVSLLVLQILDREQKAMVNKSVERWPEDKKVRGSSSTVKDRLGNVDGPPPDPAFEDQALASAVFLSTWRRRYTHTVRLPRCCGWMERRSLCPFALKADRDI